jgi:hypothetical protein
MEPVRNRPVQAKKPVPYGTGRFRGAVRTGGGSEPVGPAGFTGSGSVLVTMTMNNGGIHLMIK